MSNKDFKLNIFKIELDLISQICSSPSFLHCSYWLYHSSILWSAYVSPNSYMGSHPLKVMVLVGGDFRKYLGHEDGALMNGISGFINELREIPNSLHHVRTQ